MTVGFPLLPITKVLMKKEKFSWNSGFSKEVLLQGTSHP
jgi:hypothetical protein